MYARVDHVAPGCESRELAQAEHCGCNRDVPLIIFHALRPAADVAVPWEALTIVGIPFLVALAFICYCRDVKRD